MAKRRATISANQAKFMDRLQASARKTHLRAPVDWWCLWNAGQVEVKTWFERDRSHVELRDAESGKTYAEWWDDDVQQMFEDGFFTSGRGQGSLEKSVIDYANSIGLKGPKKCKGKVY